MITVHGLRPAQATIGNHDVPPLHVHPGEFVTVWLHNKNGVSAQVELHVQDDGTRRVVLKDPSMVATFDEVYGGAAVIPLCIHCNHKATDHTVEDEERRRCMAWRCSCEQFRCAK